MMIGRGFSLIKKQRLHKEMLRDICYMYGEMALWNYIQEKMVY